MEYVFEQCFGEGKIAVAGETMSPRAIAACEKADVLYLRFRGDSSVHEELNAAEKKAAEILEEEHPELYLRRYLPWE